MAYARSERTLRLENTTDGAIRQDRRGVAAAVDSAAILDQVKRGDPGAAELIVERFSAEIDRLLWRLLGADSEHQDLVHQVLCAVLQDASKVRDPEALAGWVRRVAVNVVCSELRKRTVRRRWSSPEPNPERFAGEIMDPLVRRRLSRIYDVLDRLPAQQRIVLCLRYFEEYSIDEIAGARNWSRRTVNRRLSQASDRFQRLAAADPELCGWIGEMQVGRHAS